MNAAAAHLESDVANGEETHEFLCQSMGFENKISHALLPALLRDRWNATIACLGGA
jgi:hypothetical protein